MDTALECSGANVKPREIKNYDGSIIQLNEQLSMDPERFTDLKAVLAMI